MPTTTTVEPPQTTLQRAIAQQNEIQVEATREQLPLDVSGIGPFRIFPNLISASDAEIIVTGYSYAAINSFTPVKSTEVRVSVRDPRILSLWKRNPVMGKLLYELNRLEYRRLKKRIHELGPTNTEVRKKFDDFHTAWMPYGTRDSDWFQEHGGDVQVQAEMERSSLMAILRDLKSWMKLHGYKVPRRSAQSISRNNKLAWNGDKKTFLILIDQEYQNHPDRYPTKRACFDEVYDRYYFPTWSRERAYAYFRRVTALK